LDSDDDAFLCILLLIVLVYDAAPPLKVLLSYTHTNLRSHLFPFHNAAPLKPLKALLSYTHTNLVNRSQKLTGALLLDEVRASFMMTSAVFDVLENDLEVAATLFSTSNHSLIFIL
jgi:hypothetical protein